MQVLILDFQVLGVFVYDFPIQVISTIYLYSLSLKLVANLLKQFGLIRF